MSGAAVFGIILIFVFAISLAIVAAMFWWAAREDGRDQKRLNARLQEPSEDGSSDIP